MIEQYLVNKQCLYYFEVTINIVNIKVWKEEGKTFCLQSDRLSAYIVLTFVSALLCLLLVPKSCLFL